MGSDRSDFKNVMEKVGIPTNLLKKRSKNYKRKFVPNKPEQTAPDPGESVYRNRALERSQLKEEYRRVQEEYELFKKQTEEESRYMGGDEEHTHLVKGLDYKLLEKVKRQLETTASDSKDIRDLKEDRDFCFTEFGFYFYKRFFYHTNLNNVNFNRKLDQTIDLLSKGYKFKANKILNLTYNFNLSNEDLPSIIINDNNTNSSGNLLTNNLELKKELIEAFNWHTENRKKKKSERLPFRPTTSTNEQEKQEDSEDDIYQNIEKYKPDEFNEEVIKSLSVNKEYLERMSVPELESTSVSTGVHRQGDKETEEDSTEIKSRVEGEEYKSRGLTYKIPEKLLKRSKFVQKQEQSFQSDIDMEDSEEEIVDKKRKKKRGEGKEWNQIQEIMKEKELSVDDYKISTNINKKDTNKGFKVV